MKSKIIVVIYASILCMLLIASSYADENDNDAANYNYQGIAYFIEGKFDLAMKAFNAAIQMFPNYAISYANRGRVYEARKQYDLAIKDYGKTIELVPSIAKSYYNRGNTYEKIGSHDLAIQDLTKAIDLNPSYAKALENRGILYWVNYKKKEESCRDLAKACSLGNCKAYDWLKHNLICL